MSKCTVLMSGVTYPDEVRVGYPVIVKITKDTDRPEFEGREVRTSPVVNITTLNGTVVVLETQNTIYKMEGIR